MHPAALNLTHSLITPESGSPSTNSAHNHAHQHPALAPIGVLSPALDSIHIQWGSNGGRSHGNKKKGNEKLGHQSLKGILCSSEILQTVIQIFKHTNSVYVY